MNLKELTEYHKNHCKEYARLIELFPNDPPYLPVGLFKTLDLKSIDESAVFKILESSGTTGAKKSKIYLDVETAKRQTEALASLMTPLLGDKRLPMLILDRERVISDRQHYSASTAALVGMMMFGRDYKYAFKDDMSLDEAAIWEWLKKQSQVLLFGMTFHVWTFLLQINHLPIQKGILIHTGGWKRMQELAVTNEIFKKTVFEKTGITTCRNFYGMVEQVGTLFIECENGFLHPPPFGDVLFRDPVTWGISDKGVIQVLSTLPTSYPGHSLLTEDLGISFESCPCGRKKPFIVTGRVPQTEVRGCSDV